MVSCEITVYFAISPLAQRTITELDERHRVKLDWIQYPRISNLRFWHLASVSF
jgi:hypothetical protein